MQKLSLFNLLLEQLKNISSVNEEYKYIGTGNPEAKILIIGKETSIYADADDQKKWEITNNFDDWKRIISNEMSDVEKRNDVNYSPSYPYKGQQLRIRNRRTGDNGGTSSTWYNYQKLYNLIYGKINNQNIDFHEGTFITEVNSSPSLKTKDADITSIGFRKDILLKSDFFQNFPMPSSARFHCQ